MSIWQQSYLVAVLETGNDKLKEKLEAVKRAISFRLQRAIEDDEERAQIVEALEGVRRLRLQQLHFHRLRTRVTDRRAHEYALENYYSVN